jgi:hypothetical protein
MKGPTMAFPRTLPLTTILATGTVAVMAAVWLAGTANATETRQDHGGATIRNEVHHDSSRPLAQMPAAPLRSEPAENEPIRLMPNRARGRHRDPVVQTTEPGPSAPSTSANFDGLGQGFTGPAGTFTVTGAPPDTNAAVGASQVVEIVNTGFGVFSKTGTPLFGPAATNTLFNGFGGSCETTNDGDGVVRYDALANRWIITQFANVGSSSGPFFECVAVSQTSDATGSWNRYSFQYASFPDYPKLSVWPDAYYTTYNLFNASGTTFLGAEDCAMNRSAMLAGTTASQVCFTTSNQFGGLLAADVEGGTAPPAGEASTVVALGTTSTTLAFWKFHVDFATPANSTFTGPNTLTVASYTAACGTSGTCIPQSGTTQQLDSLSDRVMFRLAYRNFGDHESLVVNHAVTAGSSVGVRWYELRMINGGTPSVFQQSTFAPDATFRWMASTAMDKVGNMALGYSASSSAIHPQVRITGRLAGDPLGQMTQGETTVVAGNGSQTQITRWGDYSSMVVDPADGCTFWYAQEYIPANGSFNWHTRLTSFQLPNCAGPVGNDFSISVNPTSGTVTAGGSTTTTVNTSVVSGTAESIALSASGLPAGAGASFNPTSVTAGGSSTLTITTSTSTPPGTYAVSVTGTAPSATHAASFALTVNGAGGGGITNGGFESGLSGWTSTGTTVAVTSPVHSGAGAARIGSTSPSTDSSLAQTFTVPSGQNQLSLWYKMTCPDTVTFDWFTVTLRDNTAGTTTTPLGRTCNTPASFLQVTAPVTAGHSYTLTLLNHDDNFANPPDPSFTIVDDVALSSTAGPALTNGGFESGLSGWTSTGTTAAVTSPVHSGAGAARIGSTSPSTDSSLAQTFTVNAGSQLSLWYKMSCPDTVTFDWFTVTLRDNTTGTTTTPLGRTCNTPASFLQVTAPVTAGHSYTLTLLNHDDNFANPPDPSFTIVDDITIS